jgi:outer membrane receptor protein involved in Fe transport
VRVEELRGEVSATLSGAVAPRWTLEAGAAAETSRLTQSGDVEAEMELAYFKPSLQLSRALGERNYVRVRLYRDVSQLDFEDFVTAADIQNAVVNAGNPDLRPQTSWRLEAAGDWRFGEDGALSVTLYRWAIQDALDVVPVGPPGARFDAPGNIGDATLWGGRVQFAWPLPWDAELNVDAMRQRSEATDPLTGERRELSEADESLISVELRQDLGAYAWGIDYERETEAPLFRFDRIEAEQDAEELTLWFETTAYAGLKLRAWAANLSDDVETRRRTLFDPDRLGAFGGADRRRRGEGVTLGISASGRF